MSITIGGKKMPPVKELSITREPIWSKNTGRSANGSMMGDIVAYKTKLQVTFVPLSDSQAAALAAATRPAFFNVKYHDPEDNEQKTSKMYAGSLPFKVYSYADGFPRYVGTQISLIEK